ncbi:MAG: propanediol utilization protein [Pelagimonas sp.]|jgi:uncharacterized protein involved in propanediol utilization|nr:propanediol utilization protein [Pelagimonas sp.]
MDRQGTGPKGAETCVAGHFGEWVQGRLGAEGPVALVTLHCPDFGLRARYTPAEALQLSGGDGLLDLPRAQAFLRALNLPESGHFHLIPDLPVGGGGGMSTAALVALARLAGCDGTALNLARACIAVEGASDPLMLPVPEAVLWASRRGDILQDMPVPPRCSVLGGFWGAPQRTDASDRRFADISDLVAQWQRASDLKDFAQLASQSAARAAALRDAAPCPMADLARDLGALGHVRAHTGSARGLIFASGSVPAGAASVLQQAGLRQVVQFERGGA